MYIGHLFSFPPPNHMLQYKQIFSNEDNQFLRGTDNFFDQQYKRQQAGATTLNVREGLYTNTIQKIITYS